MSSTNIQTKMILVIGTNGTGKTTLARNIMNAVRVPRKLVVTQHLDEWADLKHNDLVKPSDFKFTGKAWHLVRDPKTIMDRLQHFYNGLLLLDDARRYMTAQTDQSALNLYISRRQNAAHIIIVGHGFTQIPPQAFTFCTDIYLFATRDNLDSTRKNVVQNLDELQRVQSEVNQAAQRNWHHYQHIKY